MKKKVLILRAGTISIVLLSIVLVASISIASAFDIDGEEFTNSKLITIDNTGNANTLTDYQLKIAVNYEFEMQQGFDDLRFTDSGDNVLSYWVEDSIPGTSATVWVRVTSIPGGETTTMWMYYGNNDVSSLSDGDATFDIFEDFDHDDGEWSEEDLNDKIELDYTTDHRLKFNNWIRTDPGYVYKSCSAQNFVEEYEIDITNDWGNANTISPGFSDTLGTRDQITNGIYSTYYAGFGGPQIDIETYVNGNPEWAHGGWGEQPNRIWINTNTIYYVRLEKFEDRIKLSIFSDPARTTHIAGSPKEVTTNLVATNFNYYYLVSGYTHLPPDNPEWTSGWMDNFRVREYADPEPTVEVVSDDAVPPQIVSVEILNDNDVPTNIFTPGDTVNVKATICNMLLCPPSQNPDYQVTVSMNIDNDTDGSNGAIYDSHLTGDDWNTVLYTGTHESHTWSWIVPSQTEAEKTYHVAVGIHDQLNYDDICYDCPGYKEEWEFEARLPDLTPEDISFSNPTPEVGETVTITATIHNKKEVDVDQMFFVSFFDGAPENKDLIGDPVPIANIGAKGTAIATVSYVKGSNVAQEIFVVVDSDEHICITESDEGNNVESRVLGVSRILAVPYFHQGQTQWCAMNSIAMVMQYWGERVHSWDLARILQKPPDDGIDFVFESFCGRADTCVNTLSEGRLRNERCELLLISLWNFEDSIVNWINDSKPIIFSFPILKEGHAVVVCGYSHEEDGDYVFVHDPNGKYWSDTDNMFRKVSWDDFKGKYPTVIRTVISPTDDSEQPNPPAIALYFLPDNPPQISVMYHSIGHIPTSEYVQESYIVLDKGIFFRTNQDIDLPGFDCPPSNCLRYLDDMSINGYQEEEKRLTVAIFYSATEEPQGSYPLVIKNGGKEIYSENLDFSGYSEENRALHHTHNIHIENFEIGEVHLTIEAGGDTIGPIDLEIQVIPSIRGYVQYDDGTTPVPPASEIPVYIYQKGVDGGPIWQGRTNSEGYYICEDLPVYWDSNKPKEFSVEAKWETEIVEVIDYRDNNVVGERVPKLPEYTYYWAVGDGLWPDIIFDEEEIGLYRDAEIVFKRINDAWNYINEEWGGYDKGKVSAYIYADEWDTGHPGWCTGPDKIYLKAFPCNKPDAPDPCEEIPEYRPFVTLHEYGHAFQKEIYEGREIDPDPWLGLGESWANYFVPVVDEELWYFSTPVEDGGMDAGAALLWDIKDGGLGDDDPLDGTVTFVRGEDMIFNVMLFDNPYDFGEFYNDFIARYGYNEELQEIYEINGLWKFITVTATCPIDIIIRDPNGLIINKESSEISGATYTETDINGDGDPDDQILIPDRKTGNYQITAIPEPDAQDTDTYTLKVTAGDTTIVLAEEAMISDIPDQPYVVESTEEGIFIQNQPPVADANGPYTGVEGAPITYNGSSSYDPDGNIASYAWDFGDGDTGTGVSPEHTYVQEGTYTVTLVVNDGVLDSAPDATTATVTDTEPTADFNALPTSGSEPLTVEFTDLSSSYDCIASWSWVFGDSETSNEQNPTHIYISSGTYNVSLTIAEADDDTATKEDYITVTPAGDTISPVIESVSLDAYATIPDATIHVTVEATDNVGVTSVTADDIALVETGSTWEGDITAPSDTGDYTLTLIAEDAAENVAETAVAYSVVTPTGGLGVAILPKISSAPAGSTLLLDIKIVSTENFDDILHLYVTLDGIPSDYQADLSWFSWSDTTVQLPAGQEIVLPIEVNIPDGISGYKSFGMKAESINWNSDAQDYGAVMVT